MSSSKSLLNLNISLGRVKASQKVIFVQNLSLMLKSGLTIAEAIEIVQGQTSGKFKKVLAGVLLSIKSGQSLSDSFARYPKVFSGLFINATRAGEISGTLEENLTNIAEQLEKDKELKDKIKGAMFYPIIVFVVAFFMGLTMAFFVLPKITPLFEGLKIELPLTTRALIWFSHLIINHGTLLFTGLFITIVFLGWLVKRKFLHPITHWLLLKLPVVSSINKKINLARFCHTLGTLLKSGLNIDEALDITKESLNNYYYYYSLNKISSHVSKGGSLADGLSNFKKLYPQITTRMIKVGEKSGRLEETLFYLAHAYEVETDNATKSLATLIEPIMLIIIGLIVAFLALSIITPIYQITSNIRR